jgi:hypothetical protein
MPQIQGIAAHPFLVFLLLLPPILIPLNWFFRRFNTIF